MKTHLRLQGFWKVMVLQIFMYLLHAIMTLGLPFTHSIPWHNRPAHTQWGDSSLLGHQPWQPGLPAHPAAGWGRARHLQQGQRNTALQRWVAVFPGMLSSSGTTKTELQVLLRCEAKTQQLSAILHVPPEVLCLLHLICHVMDSLLIHIRDGVSGCPAGCRLECGAEGGVCVFSGGLSTGCLHNVPDLEKAGIWTVQEYVCFCKQQDLSSC